jgi:serine protease Do
MKQYLLKLSGAAMLLSLIATGAMAQDGDSKDKDKSKLGKNDMLILKPKTDKNTKVVIEINDGEVMVNGKPLSEFKGDDVSVSRRKELAEVLVNGSRFRSASGVQNWNSDHNMTLSNLDVFNDNKAFLGVTTEKTDGGAKISTVSEGSGADKAGLKKGDVITKINDIKVEDQDDLTTAIGKFKPEEKVTVTIKRDGKEQKVTATLGKRSLFSALATPNYNYSYSYGVGSRGRLGLKAQETEEGKGLKVLGVDDESIAEKAGLKEGDIITEFDGTAVNDIDALRDASRKAAGKNTYSIKVTRDGKAQELTVKIPKNLKTTNL